MSVPSGQRSKSKLEVQQACEELVRHTVHIMGNEKHFDPKYSYVHGRILDCALGAGEHVWTANGIMVLGKDIPEKESARRYRRRRELQETAISELNTMLYLMTLSKRLDHIRKGKYDYWSELAVRARELTRAWRDSDAHRFGRLIREEG